MNRNHGSPESILAERSILISAILINPLQFLQEFAAQHTFSLPWIKTIFCPFVLLVLVHHAAELLHLAVQHLLVGKPRCIVQQFTDMQIYFYDAVLRLFRFTSRLAYRTLVGRFFSKASCNCSALTKPYGQAVILHHVIHQGIFFKRNPRVGTCTTCRTSQCLSAIPPVRPV